MSTRGIIGIKTAKSWKGREHHWDAYPTGLGKTLWELYHGHFKKDLQKMLKVLLEDHSGWSTINRCDWAKEPGYDCPGKISIVEHPKEWQNKRPQCYCHGDRAEKLSWQTPEGDDGGAEYAYIFDPEKKTLDIMMARYRKEKSIWHTVRTLSLDARNPDWTELENVCLRF